MQCPTCGEPYEAITEFGSLQPVAHIPMCMCALQQGGTIPVGSYGKNMTFRVPAGGVQGIPSTVKCHVCEDVIPEKMAERVAGDPYCPTCFNTPPPDPSGMIADLLDLQEELRPSDRDGG